MTTNKASKARSGMKNLVSSVKRRSTWNSAPGRATKLHNLIASREFKAAEKRLVKHPHEAGNWTWIDNQAAVAGMTQLEGSNHSHEGLFRSSLASEGASLDRSGHRWTSSSIEEKEKSGASQCLPLHLACALKPPASLIRSLIEAHPDALQCRERFGMLPLHIAVQAGASNDVIAALLLSRHHGAREAAAQADEFGLLPLHLACTEGSHIRVVAALLRANPTAVAVKDRNGKTATDYLQHSTHPNKVDIQREIRRDPSYWSAISLPQQSDRLPRLHALLLRQDWDQTLALLKEMDDTTATAATARTTTAHQSKIWLQDHRSQWGSLPRLPLHIACRRRAPPHLIHALLRAYPASAQKRGGKFDLLPLHVACQSGCHIDVIRLLLQYHAKAVDEIDEFGLLPLHLAVTEGTRPDLIRILVQASPNSVHIADHSGNTPITYANAAIHPNKDQVLAILRTFQQQADVPRENNKPLRLQSVKSLVDAERWIELVYRVQEHPQEAVEVTLLQKQSFDDPMHHYQTISWLPLHYALAASAPIRIIQALLSTYPAATERPTSNKELALHIACRYRAPKPIIDALLHIYPNAVQALDDQGFTPLHSACLMGTSHAVITALLDLHPPIIYIKDNKGRTPIDILQNTSHVNNISLMEAALNGERMMQQQNQQREPSLLMDDTNKQGTPSTSSADHNNSNNKLNNNRRSALLAFKFDNVPERLGFEQNYSTSMWRLTPLKTSKASNDDNNDDVVVPTSTRSTSIALPGRHRKVYTTSKSTGFLDGEDAEEEFNISPLV